MIKDPVIRDFLSEVGREVNREIEGLTSCSFEQLHQVTRIQGRIDGLKQAVQLLEKVIEEHSKE